MYVKQGIFLNRDTYRTEFYHKKGRGLPYRQKPGTPIPGKSESPAGKKDPAICIPAAVRASGGQRMDAFSNPCRNSNEGHFQASFPQAFRQSGTVYRDFPVTIQSGRFTEFSRPGKNMREQIGGQSGPGIPYEGVSPASHCLSGYCAD
jgi:hypothetical protein